jgi:GNAT superfamily N-acetyltransferase
MKKCYIDYKHRAIADLCDSLHFGSGPGLLLTRINTPRAHRGKGVARALMAQILSDADAEGVTLFLHISPSDGLNYNQLKAWYERCGFVDRGIVFRRDPR